MDRQGLRAELDRALVDPAFYDLEGAARDNTFVLRGSGGKWVVFFSERGRRWEERQFDTEDGACRYLLHLVLRDHVVHPSGESGDGAGT